MNTPPSILQLVPGLAEYAATLKPETPEDTAAREAREQAELEALRRPSVTREAVLRDRGIPAKDLRRLLEGRLRETPALQRARRWLGEPRPVLVLSGPPDAGKTTASAWAAAQDPSEADGHWWQPATGKPAVVYLEAEMLLRVWLFRGPGREPITGRSVEDLVTCWLLVIDDLGQEASADGIVALVGDAVDTLLRRRSDRLLRTLITTNIPFASPEHEAKAVAAGLAERDQTRADPLSVRYGARGQRMLQTLTEHGGWKRVAAEGLRMIQEIPT